MATISICTVYTGLTRAIHESVTDSENMRSLSWPADTQADTIVADAVTDGLRFLQTEYTNFVFHESPIEFYVR